ncbi:unnamed protein product [Cuscuta epithymum]|uniref:Uncharacterized protein n=2 Tax=Cuscuta epithymum TaxID=186058 RepID=A0AAV0DGX1_9ASTE|nr:unnamed protein product [Cuscuta epithymum]
MPFVWNLGSVNMLSGGVSHGIWFLTAICKGSGLGATILIGFRQVWILCTGDQRAKPPCNCSVLFPNSSGFHYTCLCASSLVGSVVLVAGGQAKGYFIGAAFCCVMDLIFLSLYYYRMTRDSSSTNA